MESGRESKFTNAQICENGHVVTSDVSYGTGSKRCPECGASTLTACPSCQIRIRGFYVNRLVYGIYDVPAFCHECGEPYPWTARKAEEAEELLDELDGLNADERGLLKKSIPDIMAETPRTELAALRFKKMIAKVGGASRAALVRLVQAIAIEAVKGQMGM